MVYIIFLVAAIVVVGAAIKLNEFGDVISRKSALSGAAVGTFLIAGATSLPELTTSLTAVYIDNPDIAVGNMIGSNVFNLLILAIVDIIYRRRRLFQRVGYQEHKPAAIMGLIFMIIIIGALALPQSIEWFGVGIEMVVLALLYILMIKFFSNKGEEEKADEDLPVKDYKLKTAVTGFIVMALVVFGAGSALSISGDQLAQVSGLDSSFVGSFLIAASTSLPELVTVLAAFKVANYGMAIGSILGSNIFNMQLLVLTDILYRDQAILSAAGNSHIFIGLLGVFMTLVTIYLLWRPAISNQWRYIAPSMIVSLVYVVFSYIIF
ncbi:sodium:calcium antiporter [Halobacillus sp. A1]|uniref:sodium:calcium antiporter n=1 Tax=Halobacillus sp. A1 TaxID=2880262 RepID=UPI0020A6B47D|nr:sodium:calcium antiporter [Halobacillus sp. A1]MCP3029954.1 sodium:calcium antiporter [Halobacillus sp. A1]